MVSPTTSEASFILVNNAEDPSTDGQPAQVSAVLRVYVVHG
jgi:hypothetical protein